MSLYLTPEFESFRLGSKIAFFFFFKQKCFLNDILGDRICKVLYNMPHWEVLAQWPGCESQLHHFLAVWSWTSYLTSLCLFPHLQNEHSNKTHLIQLWGLNECVHFAHRTVQNSAWCLERAVYTLDIIIIQELT